jgi:predicted RNase H-like nuclease/ppGpp synthetase/RelA/SpoT-type nucleotidyltranferase
VGAVHYVGIDLAWGQKNPTGVAVLDADARLLHVEAVRSDDEVVASVAAYVEGDCLVAIDAPLVVTNATGSRPAEQQLGADFRVHDAGPHPSNTGKPEFAGGVTRGATVAKRLKLDLDPRSGRRRRAIEVYPHPATIVLFGLEKVVRYKQKPGRDLELLRSELLRLMGLVETRVTTNAAWDALREAVETAHQKAQLRRVEDQVDAVLCALVAHFVDHHPDQVTVYGDARTGAIVTPSKPPPGPSHADVVREAVRSYAARHPALTRAGHDVVGLVQGLLDEAGINYLSVTGRTKAVASFAEKAARTGAGGRPLYPEPLTDITDQVGVRVITYVSGDVAAVADVLGDNLVVIDDRDLGRETASEGRFGYASRHLLLDVSGQVVQVQVRTVLQHAWAEFEHDIRYKGVVPAEHASEFDRRFTLAAGLLELADRELGEIRERLRGAPPPAGPAHTPDDDPRLEPRELAAFLAGQYSDADWSRTDHYGWIAGILLELGVTSLDELGDVLRSADESLIAARMAYRHPPGAVRRLDDALLWVFGERYVALHANAHRRQLLAARLERMTAAGG